MQGVDQVFGIFFFLSLVIQFMVLFHVFSILYNLFTRLFSILSKCFMFVHKLVLMTLMKGKRELLPYYGEELG